MSSQTANTLLTAHSTLVQRARSQQQNRRQILESNGYEPNFPAIPSPSSSPPPITQSESGPSTPRGKVGESSKRVDLPPEKKARMKRYRNYIPGEETIRNDYSQHYVDSGEWPQNWILGAAPEDRFEEYPKQQRLIAMKKAAVEEYAHPPMYYPISQLSNMQYCKFDSILIDPPFSSSFSWDSLLSLPISALGADPSFIWLWVGSGAKDGHEKGREVLAKWGYRRCEDIVWVKTNRSNVRGPGCDPATTSLFTRTKEHCLMGIRGTVRRSTDNWFVHCNIDTDVIVWEGDPDDPSRKPPEMYTLIENFCLGTRRLELFGGVHSLRRGWVTMGENDPSEEVLREKGATIWDKEQWVAKTRVGESGKFTVPSTSEIETLRPKSPQRPNSNLPATNPVVPQPNIIPNNIVMANSNPMMGAFAPHPPGVIPGMMPMGVPMGMGMGMPIGMNPAMQMMPMGMNMGMNPMGMQQFGPAPGMGMPMWMGMPEGVNPMMGNMWMGDGAMNNMGGWTPHNG